MAGIKPGPPAPQASVPSITPLSLFDVNQFLQGYRVRVPNLFSDVADPVQHEAGEDGEGLGDLDEPGQAEALVHADHLDDDDSLRAAN